MRTCASLIVVWISTLALTAAAGAQTTPGTPATPSTPRDRTATPSRPKPAAPHAETTITGCLKRLSDMERAEGSGASKRKDVSGTVDDFVLMDATVGRAPAAAGSSTPATARQRPAYRIQGLGRAQLEPHLNKRVELTGTMDAARTAPPAGQHDSGGASKTTGQSGQTRSGQPSSPEGTGGNEALRRPPSAPAAQDAGLPVFPAQRVRVVADRCDAS